MDEPTVSFETTREHYGVWRWRLERDSSNRLEKLWTQIARSNLDGQTKVELANVAWALAAFERAYKVLLEDIVRSERAHSEGVPAVMKELTGPYKHSLDYLLAMSLWMDLGDVLAAYRIIVERLVYHERQARRRISPKAIADVQRQLRILRARTLPRLSARPVTKLADAILHGSWHRGTAPEDLAFEIHWKNTEPRTLDFTTGDFRGSLENLVDETLKQVHNFILAVVQPAAASR